HVVREGAGDDAPVLGALSSALLSHLGVAIGVVLTFSLNRTRTGRTRAAGQLVPRAVRKPAATGGETSDVPTCPHCSKHIPPGETCCPSNCPGIGGDEALFGMRLRAR